VAVLSTARIAIIFDWRCRADDVLTRPACLEL
jgi:hypothetical protein